MKRITDLRSEIAQKRSRMKAIMDLCEKETRSRSEAEKTEWANLKKEADDAEVELRDLEEQDRINRSNATPVNAPAIHTEKKDLSNFSIYRGLSLLSQGKQLDGAEKEVHDIAVEEARLSNITPQGFAVPSFLPKEKRGQTSTGQTSVAGDQGGFTVPTIINGFIEALWAKNFLSEVGATRLAGLTGNLSIPVQTTKPSASELTEIEQMSDTEILFSDVDMSPNRRGITIPLSKLIMIQSSLDMQNLVMEQMRKALGYKLNIDAITAILAAITTGNGNLLALDTNGAIAEYPDFVALETLVANANAEKDGMKYLTNTKVRGKAKVTQKFSTTNGDPIWEKGNEVNGYPAVVANTVPSNLTKGSASGVCSAIVFGNFSDCYVGMWGGMDFVVDPYSAKRKHQIEITANMFWDVEIARALSFAGIKDALTTN
jgi:HK97 family phage major capsid protein